MNAAARDGGELRAEALTHDGRAIAGFSAADCRAVEGDSTAAAVRWAGGEIGDAAAQEPSGAPQRLRFHIASADLYAFWIA